MGDAGSGWELLWPAMLWEHRRKLRRKHPFLFWTSVLILAGLAALLIYAALRQGH